MLKRILLGSTLLALAACDNSPASQDAPSSVQVAVVEPAEPQAVATASEAEAEVKSQPAPAPVATASATPQRLSQQPVLLPAPSRSEKPRQVSGAYTPPAGSAERVDLMNALRAQVRGDMGGDPVFVVRELRSNGQWAFARLEPQWRDGRAIDVRKTPFYRQEARDRPVDNLDTEVIWQKERGRWQVFAHNIAATDAWWLAYCDQVPRAVLGAGC